MVVLNFQGLLDIVANGFVYGLLRVLST